MRVVIAWWDGTRSAGTPHADSEKSSAGRAETSDIDPDSSSVGEFPGLRTSHWLTDPTADRQGLALPWDSAASAARSLPALAAKTSGHAPSDRWAFELDEALQPKPGGSPGLPQEPSLPLHA
ncbi:hypothetical protein [Streptomyces sp. NRRL S-37]|uniref:hypothetical protein n=1 Tax=Streptomyces sp. NRRL S-37 TaxID=1463903 RepID=UPI000689FEC8|nr:hypothetical protein [Streptomyces sp. NRRL S-37]